MTSIKTLFSEYQTLTDQEFKDMRQNCIFVLDANVLLDLYRVRPEASEKTLKILTTIKEQVWIPYQVALEYQKHRHEMLIKPQIAYDSATALVSKSHTALTTDLQEAIKKTQGLFGKMVTDVKQHLLENAIRDFEMPPPVDIQGHLNESIQSLKTELNSAIRNPLLI